MQKMRLRAGSACPRSNSSSETGLMKFLHPSFSFLLPPFPFPSLPSFSPYLHKPSLTVEYFLKGPSAAGDG